MKPLRVLISAGEPSGDHHGAHLARALGTRSAEIWIDALGGPELRRTAARVRWPSDSLGAIGLVEVITSLPAHLRLLRAMGGELAKGKYNLLVCIDYPGFNLRLAEQARRHGVPVLWYIAPQLWAWRAGRASRMARAIDRMAVILPFEQEYFSSVGIRAEHVGHPLLDGPPPPNRAAARAALGIAAADRVLALFPGSRPAEIRRLWPRYRDAARRLSAAGQCDSVLVAAVGGGEYPDPAGTRLIPGGADVILAAADAAVVTSGTATLEAAIADVPMVVAYRVHPLTHRLARRLLSVPWISLVNLIADREVVPELIQGEATVDRIVRETAPLLDGNKQPAAEQRAAFREIRGRLGGAGASGRVADLALEMMS
ncbi:MAG: lipid-A-disaccharide synthase [Gemmatimonadales bacterium]|nr:lipid-A-disaccharide synthase [Gemmatimonadales bacterium]